MCTRAYNTILQFSIKIFIQYSEVISLRTAGKRLPGKKCAIYIGSVISVLILSYNLTKNLSFIMTFDKKGISSLTLSIAIHFVFIRICHGIAIKNFSAQNRRIKGETNLFWYHCQTFQTVNSFKGLYFTWKQLCRSSQFKTITYFCISRTPRIIY